VLLYLNKEQKTGRAKHIASRYSTTGSLLTQDLHNIRILCAHVKVKLLHHLNHLGKKKRVNIFRITELKERRHYRSDFRGRDI
jgi:hypothetical protein